MPQEPLLPTRIKRNTACTACRDAKVRCNPSHVEGQPCQRCVKLDQQCVVDKTHKRVSRKSKIDELVHEIQAIKQTVGGNTSQPAQTSASTPAKALGFPNIGITSPGTVRSNYHVSSMSNPTPVSITHTPATTLVYEPSPHAESSLPRALGSQPFSGDDIDYYFRMLVVINFDLNRLGWYFEHFHTYMPIVRHRNPNHIYDLSSLLFWTIILTSCRQYARNPAILSFLMDSVRREIFAAVSTVPVSIHTINALIMVCTWVFPDSRFITDPPTLFSGAAMNACLLLGVHTGKGSNPEYGFGVFQTNFTDEEAAYTWAGYNIVSQRLSQYLGLPPIGNFFNQTIQNIIDGRTPFQVPPGFRVLLECQKFSNRVSKTTAACLEETRGVSPHLVRQLEDEFDAIRALICTGRANDLDHFNALLVQLEIQAYYFMPLAGHSPDALKRDIMRAYTTAGAVIRMALDLDRHYKFLQHLPHFYFRSILSSTSVISMVHWSSYKSLLDAKAMDELASDAVSICRRSSVQEGDLSTRLATLLETIRTIDHLRKPLDEPITSFSHRLGASVTFDCLKAWKAAMTEARPKSQPPPAEGAETPSAFISADPLATMDWSFMDDFDWNFEPTLLAPIA